VDFIVLTTRNKGYHMQIAIGRNKLAYAQKSNLAV